MRVLILHDAVPPGASADEADALVQAAAVAGALHALGHETETLALTLDLEAARAELERRPPDLVFNLVEAPGGHGRLIHTAPALLETLAIPFTGASSAAQFATSNKLVAKRTLRAHGLPTPPWIELQSQAGAVGGRSAAPGPGCGTYIIKSVWEHASVGLDEDSIIETDSPDELQRAIEARLPQLGGEGFAEAYIDGREFNLSLLAGGTGVSPVPEVLPPAEIIFDGYAASKPKVVGYRAKWASDSFEYHHTPPHYDFGSEDAPLLDELAALALACWRLFDLRGHARVDFRVDSNGKPWILEVNANPCLSPDAGFAAALERAAIPFAHAIDRIMGDTLRVSRAPAAALR